MVQALRAAAITLKSSRPEIVQITLFGSFASGVPTPRSDADLLIEVPGSLDWKARHELAQEYTAAFQAVGVPVEVIVGTSDEISAGVRAGRSVAAVAHRHGLRLT